MRDFGASGNQLNFIRYRGLKGPLQRLHPGVKLGVMFLGLGVVAACGSISGLAVILLFLMAAAPFASLNPGALLRPVLPVLPFLLLILLIHALTLPRAPGEPLLSAADIPPAALMLIRIISAIMLLGLTTAITPTAEISYGIEALLSPLAPFGFPAAEAGLIATLTFRFIPFLREEGERLAKAQTARGGDLGYRSRNPFRRMKASLPVMVPLFIGTLRKAEILGESMHLRGYAGSRLGDRLHRYSLSRKDLIWLLCSLGCFAGALWCWFADCDRQIFTTLPLFRRFP